MLHIQFKLKETIEKKNLDGLASPLRVFISVIASTFEANHRKKTVW